MRLFGINKHNQNFDKQDQSKCNYKKNNKLKLCGPLRIYKYHKNQNLSGQAVFQVMETHKGFNKESRKSYQPYYCSNPKIIFSKNQNQIETKISTKIAWCEHIRTKKDSIVSMKYQCFLVTLEFFKNKTKNVLGSTQIEDILI